jgi:hypothetical protein
VGGSDVLRGVIGGIGGRGDGRVGVGVVGDGGGAGGGDMERGTSELKRRTTQITGGTKDIEIRTISRRTVGSAVSYAFLTLETWEAHLTC